MILERKIEEIDHLMIEQIQEIESEILNQVEYLKSNHIIDIQGQEVGHHPKVNLGGTDLYLMKEESNHIIDIQGQKVGHQMKISPGEIELCQMKKETNPIIDIQSQEVSHQMKISLGETDLGQMREGPILEKDMSQDRSTEMEVKEVGQDLQIVNIQDTARMVEGHQSTPHQ